MNESYTERNRLPHGEFISQLNNHGQLIDYSHSMDDQVFNLVRSRSGTSMPDWRDKIRRGENATTPFSGTRRVLDWTWGDVFSRRPNGPGPVERKAYGAYMGFEVPPVYSGSTTTANNLALKSILKKIRQRRTAFQGGISLGELRETIKMLRHPAAALSKAVSSYMNNLSKRLPRTKKQNKRKVISDTWLEYSFGWSPFISDISEALKAIRKLKERDVRKVLIGSGASEEATADWVSYSHFWASDQPVLGSRTTIVRIEVRYIAGVCESTEVLTAPQKFEHFGFVKSQLVPTLWELTPWSFLVDYFTNIGDILDATATNTSDVRWVCKTVRISNTYRFTNTLDKRKFYQDFPINSYIEGTPGQGEITTRTVTRSAYSSLPSPEFSVDIPGKSQYLQWLNMAALVASRKNLLSKLNRG